MRRQALYNSCILFLLVLIFSFQTSVAAGTFTLRGYVKDSTTQEPLPGVNIIVNQGKYGTTTNLEGFYELPLLPGQYEITFSFISYREQRYLLDITADRRLDVLLAQAYILADEIVIQATPEDQHLQKTIDNVALDAKQIAQMPFLLGEVDPVKAIQLLPGVQTSGDGNTGFYVRGGGIDQNLILLDGATIYNAGHLLGFFSVFDGNALENVELIKGGIPAQYGGRLSSILNITAKSGDKQSWKAEGAAGLIAAHLKVEGPLVKNKSSLLLTGRRTYYDAIHHALLEKTSLNTGINGYFHDANIKLDYLFSDKDKLTLSGYTGKDNFQYTGLSSFTNDMRWGNSALSSQWTHAFSSKLFSESSLSFSDYSMGFEADISSYHFSIASNVREAGYKYTLSYALSDQHELTGGLQAIRRWFTPGNVEAYTEETSLNLGNKVQLHTLESALFLNDEFSFDQHWKVSAGIRVSLFNQLGPFQRYQSASTSTVADTISYPKNKTVVQYAHTEPRLAITYLINTASSVKLSYDQAFQYVHMVPMASASLPTDVWVPSSSRIKPQLGRQYALGYFTSFQRHAYEGSLIVYLKNMHNQVEYRDGVIISYDRGLNFDDNFLFGKGRAYGSELFLKKNKGLLTGWLAYTLSKTTRRFEEINGGRSYPAKYDRLHDLSLLANYRVHPKWSLSGVFVFSTGNTMTLPVARYVINSNIINEYDGRNNLRLPPYHRMDVSATYYPRHGGGRYRSSWIFSIYNLYSRLNPYYLYFDVKGDINAYDLEVKAKQVSLFPVIPSVTYQFSF